jgi:hypothetical protein
MTAIIWFLLFKEIFAVKSENHTKPINTFCGQNSEQLNMKAGGIYSYHWGLKVNKGRTWIAVREQSAKEYIYACGR